MRWFALLLVPLLVSACDRDPVGLADRPSAGQPDLAVVNRSDSLSKGAYVSWQDGQLTHYVAVNEVVMAGSKWVRHVYGAYDPTTWVFAFQGYGYVSPKDVRGSGQGILQLATNTDPSVYPDFGRENHAGGPIEILWQATPQSAWRDHWIDSFEWGHLVFKYNTIMTMRDAGAYLDTAHFFAALSQVEGSLASRFSPGSHEHNHALRIRSTCVIE